MEKITLLIILLFNLSAIAQKKSKQIEFTYENQKIVGTLKNSFKNLINEIEVKIDNQNVQNFQIKKMSDITIDDETYTSSLNDVDLNLTTNPSDFDKEANPKFTKSWILLKILVQGNYKLYSFEQSNFTQFYFSSPISTEIQPLIFKEYFISFRVTKSNLQFQNQLHKDSPQSNLSFIEYKKIKYKKDNLITYFNRLNDYKPENGIVKTKFKFSIFAGISMNKFNVNKFEYTNNIETYQLIIGKEGLQKIASHLEYTSPTIGVKTEMPLGYKGNSAVFSDLGVSIYNQKFFLDKNGHGKTNINHEKKSTVLNLNIGYKYYFEISKNIQLYPQAAVSIITYINHKNYTSWETSIGPGSDNGFKTGTFFAGTLGIGIKLNKHYYIETNFRQSIEGENTIKTFILGYTF